MKNEYRNKPLELAQHKSPALLTAVLIGLVMYVSFQYHPAHGELWLEGHVFQASKVLELFNQQHYTEILQMFFYSNFLTINVWQLVCAIYFFFTFGLAVESRLGPGRFIFLVLMAATIPWLVQFWDVLNNPVWPFYFEHIKTDTYFFGPAYILCTLAGAYAFLIPKTTSHELYIMQSNKLENQLFNRKKAKPLTEYFGLPSELFTSAFILYEIVQRGFVILPWKDMDTLGLYAAISSILVAWVFSATVLHGLRSSFMDHPMKLAAIQQYSEMIDLDVDSDTAIKGTARTLGLPDDQVRTWIIENKGKLRTK